VARLRLLCVAAVAGGGVLIGCSAVHSHGDGGRGPQCCDREGRTELRRNDGAAKGDGPGVAGRVEENSEGKEAWQW
jgi:hypothetical protein